jgi:D-galactose 1-dehydrogenase/L-arabinose 1- dehydrogenase
VGKIARDQHIPALARDPRFRLIATADPAGGVAGVQNFASIDALLAEGPKLDAVSICTPPGVRGAVVAAAVAAGLHVMLEKPPAATLSQVESFRAQAAAPGTTLFATWHAREAGAVAPARAWLAGKRITGFAIHWQENIRQWHPGQDWILAAGGYGVFDPGINALSIATAILPDAPILTAATMVVPAGRQSPISATLDLACGTVKGEVTFDFLRQGEQLWDMEVETDAGMLAIRKGGEVLEHDGATRTFANEEYPRLYARFADLIAGGESDVDVSPLRLVADAFLLGERTAGPAFDW